ncbi:MAG: DUF418 domain-containing protein [Alphaproteobacteria bacterium]|nr:DUF418 domain-containing protein [Alphaproteobacteria bacterium]
MTHPRPQFEPAPDLRIVEIDVLRGIALIGIYWINVVIFALPHGAYSLPELLGEARQLNVGLWAFSEIFVEGAMRGLFSILFGASTLIFLNEAKLESKDGIRVVDRYYRRCLTLILFALVHAFILLGQWDLLYAYGLLGMFLFPLRNLKGTTLIAVALALFVISDFNTFSDNYEALQGNEEARQLTLDRSSDYRDQVRKNNLDDFQADFDTYRSTYLDIFKAQIPVIVEQQSSKMYSDHFFDVGGMMLIGMALFKLGVLTGQRSLRFYLILAAVGYATGGMLHGVECYELWRADFNSEARDPFLMMPYNIGRLMMTLGHLGTFGILVRRGVVARIAPYLAPLGRMALTNYVGQTVLSVLFFYGFGLGYFGYLERYELTWVFLAVIAIQLIASNIWLRHYRIGPLEWLWRSMIYGRYQPMRRAPSPVAARP